MNLRSILAALCVAFLARTSALATFTLGVALLDERPTSIGLVGAVLTIMGVTFGVVTPALALGRRRKS